MRMESKKTNGVLVITPVDPRIEAASSSSFKAQVVDWISQGYNRIVLDLSNVKFIDSSGLGTIISILKSVGEEGELFLCQIQKPVMGLFKLTRTDRVFRIFDTLEEAVSKLSA